jgi:hypothetical protein
VRQVRPTRTCGSPATCGRRHSDSRTRPR